MKKRQLKPYLSTDVRRKLIAKAYPDNNEWQDSVQKMYKVQVCAIYDTFIKEGRIYFDEVGVAHFRTTDELRKLKEAKKDFHTKCHQITLDEWMAEKVQ